MSIGLAVAASVMIGSGEALAGQYVQEHRSEVVTASFFAIGIPITIALMFFVPSSWQTTDVVAGLASGIVGGMALLLLYSAYRSVPVGVAIPMIGVQSAVWPVLFAVVFRNEQLTTLTLAGVVLGVVALFLVSFDPTAGIEARRGVLQALLSGVLFAAMILLIATTSEESGLWSVLAQRSSAFVFVAIYALKTGPTVFPEHSRAKVMTVGSFGTLGAAAYVIAAQRGSLTEVAVAGSQFPAAAVIVSYLAFRVTVRWWQTVGLLAAATAVTLVALG